MRALLLFIPVIILSACTGSVDRNGEEQVATIDTAVVLVDPVGLFRGTLPCADCPGIDTKLWLRADGTYLQLATYQDRDTMPFGRMGAWVVDEDVVQLDGASGKRYDLTGTGLRELLQEGASTRTELIKVDGNLLDLPMRMTGAYTYADDTHTLQPCGMQHQIPLGMQQAGLEMALWYTEDNAAGAPLLVEIQAHLGMGPSMEGDEEEEYLFVEKVLRRLNGSCPDISGPL